MICRHLHVSCMPCAFSASSNSILLPNSKSNYYFRLPWYIALSVQTVKVTVRRN